MCVRACWWGVGCGWQAGSDVEGGGVETKTSSLCLSTLATASDKPFTYSNIANPSLSPRESCATRCLGLAANPTTTAGTTSLPTSPGPG